MDLPHRPLSLYKGGCSLESKDMALLPPAPHRYPQGLPIIGSSTQRLLGVSVERFKVLIINKSKKGFIIRGI